MKGERKSKYLPLADERAALVHPSAAERSDDDDVADEPAGS